MNLLTQLSFNSKPKTHKPNFAAMRCVDTYREAFSTDTLSPQEVADRLGYNQKSCYHTLKKLCDAGHVELVGTRRKNKVGATENLYRWSTKGKWEVSQHGVLIVVESPDGEVWNVYDSDECAWALAKAILKGELK